MATHRIGVELRGLNNLLRRRAEASAAHSDLDALTGAHGYVLGFLSHNRHRDVYQRDIEEAFSIRPSTATVILQHMEQNGLIVREVASHDARRKRIVLTDKALALDARVRAEHDETEALLREGVTPEELATFFRVVRLFRENLERGATHD